MKHKNIILSVVMLVFFFALAAFAWFRPADEFSEAERRKLAQAPEFSVKNVASGKFMKDFETYSLDQFPGWDLFRSLKAEFSLNVFGRRANNDIYINDEGYASKMDYPLNPD